MINNKNDIGKINNDSIAVKIQITDYNSANNDSG